MQRLPVLRNVHLKAALECRSAALLRRRVTWVALRKKVVYGNHSGSGGVDETVKPESNAKHTATERGHGAIAQHHGKRA